MKIVIEHHNVKKHRKSLLIFTACLFTLIITDIPSRAGEHTTRGTLTGRAIDSQHGRGIPDASITVSVTLSTYKATTDSNGNFKITGIPPGINYSVNVTKTGYKSVTFQVSISAGEITRYDCSLTSRYLKLLYPNGGESIFAGSEIVIRWKAVGIKRIRLEFSINSGKTWLPLEDNYDASTGSYTWDVPDLPSPDCIIRIIETEENGLMDMSDGMFKNSSI